MPSPSRFSGASTALATAPPSRDIPGHQSTSPIKAVEHIRRMRGGSQSHLMRCSDGHYYVVKFQNNPQDRRVLVNELLGTLLARLLGLPTATPEVVCVCDELIRLTPELCIELPRSRVPCQSGPQFGSRYVGDPRRHVAFDFSQTRWSAKWTISLTLPGCSFSTSGPAIPTDDRSSFNEAA